MKIAESFLEQAEKLSTSDPRRPKQVNLRRAVSAAYYGLFHLLTWEAAMGLVGDERIAKILMRTYEHSEIKRVSREFSKGRAPSSIDSIEMPEELRSVAAAVVSLQEERHRSDYDLSIVYRRREVIEQVSKARKAFEDWKKVRNREAARVYLACFLLWDRWEKARRG
ncbi:MAG: hypothetical protein SFX72_10295 [Isosphaeraceae bacterium]|nr:hypothetical protein [Isosphaeraceae bacterium]